MIYWAWKAIWTWDGLGDIRQSLPVGIYIVYADLFTLSGMKKQFKKVGCFGQEI